MFTKGTMEFVTSREHLPEFISSLSGHFTLEITGIYIGYKILQYDV